MLALRSRGLGSAWTTLHLRYEQEAAALLGLPPTLTQAVLLPVAYYTGDDFQPAKRTPAAERTSWNGWGKRREEGE
jgi:nitroreductase